MKKREKKREEAPNFPMIRCFPVLGGGGGKEKGKRKNGAKREGVNRTRFSPGTFPVTQTDKDEKKEKANLSFPWGKEEEKRRKKRGGKKKRH